MIVTKLNSVPATQTRGSCQRFYKPITLFIHPTARWSPTHHPQWYQSILSWIVTSSVFLISAATLNRCSCTNTSDLQSTLSLDSLPFTTNLYTSTIAVDAQEMNIFTELTGYEVGGWNLLCFVFFSHSIPHPLCVSVHITTNRSPLNLQPMTVYTLRIVHCHSVLITCGLLLFCTFSCVFCYFSCQHIRYHSISTLSAVSIFRILYFRLFPDRNQETKPMERPDRRE